MSQRAMDKVESREAFRDNIASVEGADDETGFHGEIKNEFSHVNVTIDYEGNDPRLKLVDRFTGNIRYLDSLELECLTRMSTDFLDHFLPY